MTDALRTLLEADARRLGFSAVGVARAAENAAAAAGLEAFVREGFHGTMGWMPETTERRRSVQALWPEARTAIVLGLNYGPAEDPLAPLADPTVGAISVYARHRDYHDVLKGKLKELAGRLLARARLQGDGGAHDAKVFVDTAPLMEKPLGQAAGLGWQGKHTNLVSRDHGSWLFLGSILTTLDLAPDVAGRDLCGSCRACQDACPTDAFPAPYQLDARRCISYLTIETKAPIPRAFRRAMGNRIYGCDDCLAACPWNKFAQAASEAKLQAREDLKAPTLADLLQLDDAGFRALFAGSPIKRVGRAKFVSNCLVAAGNSGRAEFLGLVRTHLADPEPLVRAMAVWALGELAPAAARLERPRRVERETDPIVLEEWHAVS